MASLADYFNLRPKDPRVQFWTQPDRWPIDSKSHLFAARAILELGRRRFGDNWSDTGPATALTEPLPELSVWTPMEEVRRGIEIICRRDQGILGGFAGIGCEFANREARGTCFPTDAEWKMATKHAKSDQVESWQRLDPFLHVVQELTTACHSGNVVSGIRPLIGGEVIDKDYSFWNFEFNVLRFDTCKLDLAHPFNTHPAQPDHWLFIERQTFAKLLAEPFNPTQAAVREEVIVQKQRNLRTRGRRPEYDWEEMGIEFGQRMEAGEFTDEISTSEIANKLADSLAERGKKVPDHKTISDKVSRWRELRSNSGQ